MSFLDKLRNLIAGPPRYDEAGDAGAELDADLAEETPAAHEDWEQTLQDERRASLGAGQIAEEIKLQPSLAAFEEAEEEEEKKDSEWARPDPTPPE
jgi:hypothetical protein